MLERLTTIQSLTNHDLVDARGFLTAVIAEIDSELRERDGRHRIAHLPHGAKS